MAPLDGNPAEYIEVNPEVEETRRELRGAARVVRERGLTTILYMHPLGQVCGVCAIAIAEGRMTDKKDWEAEKMEAARSGVAGRCFANFIGSSIDYWVQGKTAEQVAQAMERAAESLS